MKSKKSETLHSIETNRTEPHRTAHKDAGSKKKLQLKIKNAIDISQKQINTFEQIKGKYLIIFRSLEAWIIEAKRWYRMRNIVIRLVFN